MAAVCFENIFSSVKSKANRTNGINTIDCQQYNPTKIMSGHNQLEQPKNKDAS
jgi:hypothetical protein